MVQPYVNQKTQQRACFNCGDPTHFKNACPRLINVINAPLNPPYQANQLTQYQHHPQPIQAHHPQANQIVQAPQATPPVEPQGPSTTQAPPTIPQGHGRAFNINLHQARASNEVINGKFLLNGFYASVLFDSGADRSFVSLEFESLLAKPRVKLDNPLFVEVANGQPISIDSMIRDCTLRLHDQDFSIDLIPMKLGCFDVIVGMDWLSSFHAEILCFEKCLNIPRPDGSILKVHGETLAKESRIVSCVQAHKYLRKGYLAYLVHVEAKKEQERSIDDIPVVREFPDVFPETFPVCLPPVKSNSESNLFRVQTLSRKLLII